jgi:hypothetical protein
VVACSLYRRDAETIGLNRDYVQQAKALGLTVGGTMTSAEPVAKGHCRRAGGIDPRCSLTPEIVAHARVERVSQGAAVNAVNGINAGSPTIA